MELGPPPPATRVRPNWRRPTSTRSGAGGVALLVVLALLSLMLAARPQPARAQTASSKSSSPALGFDTCGAPSAATMSAWWASSPYTSVGVYIGGALRGCQQPNLTPTWVSTVVRQGWRLIPIWVGPQAPCGGFSSSISTNTSIATAQGVAEADAASAAASALGIGLSPIYYDMEGYARGGSCSAAVQAFMNGWVSELHAKGSPAALYSSLCSGILDVAALYQAPGYNTLDAIWIAAWNGSANLFGFTGSCALSDSVWPNHQRLHQYAGGHDESWGGVTINVDTNAVDGPLAPRIFSPPDAPSMSARGGNGLVHLQWSLPGSTGGLPIALYRISRSTTPNGESSLILVAGRGTSFDDRSVTNGVRYYYTVSALTFAGEGAQSNEASAVPSGPTTVDVVTRDDSNALSWQHFDGSAWSGWQSLGPTIVGTPTSVTDGTGVWAFARGADNALWYRHYDNSSWSSWVSLGPTITGDPAAAADGTGVAVFARGPDNGIWTRRYTYATTSWSAWSSLGPSITGTVSAVSGGTGLWVFGRGTDNGLWYQRYSDAAASLSGTPGWSGWQSLGPTIVSDPSATADATGVWVFARGADNGLWARRLIEPGGGWSGWVALGPTITGTPSAAADASGVWAFARGADDALWYRRWSNASLSWTPWSSLGPTIISSPVARIDGASVRVFARGVDNALWYRVGVPFAWLPWASANGALTTDTSVSLGP
jgi:Rv2525c-like, glycoside hydrolase-like domain